MTVNAGVVRWLLVATSVPTIVAFVCYCLLRLYLKAKQNAYDEAWRLHEAARIALSQELFPDQWAAYKQAKQQWQTAYGPIIAAYNNAMEVYRAEQVRWDDEAGPAWYGDQSVNWVPAYGAPIMPSKPEYPPEPVPPSLADIDSILAERRRQGLLKLPDIPNSWGCHFADGEGLTGVLLTIWVLGLLIAVALGVLLIPTNNNLVPK